MHISMMQFLAGLVSASKRFAETRSQLRYGAVPGDWGPSPNKQFCRAKSQSVYHSALLASFVLSHFNLFRHQLYYHAEVERTILYCKDVFRSILSSALKLVQNSQPTL